MNILKLNPAWRSFFIGLIAAMWMLLLTMYSIEGYSWHCHQIYTFSFNAIVLMICIIKPGRLGWLFILYFLAQGVREENNIYKEEETLYNILYPLIEVSFSNRIYIITGLTGLIIYPILIILMFTKKVRSVFNL